MADLKSNAEAIWTGELKTGTGKTSGKSGAFMNVEYTFATRFEGQEGSNPEELIAAAHAACFSMQLSGVLGKGGHSPESIHTDATITLSLGEGGPRVSRIHLKTEAGVPGIDDATLQEAAETAKKICPISKLLTPGLDEITMEATLV
ncbi:MAG: OsmC family peroxiredoxin [Bradymonadaceae bacterium]